MIFHFSFSSFLVDCSHCHLLHQEMLQFFLPQHILPVLKTAVLSSGPFSLIQSIDRGQKENLLVNNTVIFFIPGDHQITLSHINGDITSLIFPQRTISTPSLHLGILYYIARVLRSWSVRPSHCSWQLTFWIILKKFTNTNQPKANFLNK